MLCAGREGGNTAKVNSHYIFGILKPMNLQLILFYCQGDSGGPLTVEEDGVHTLAGVISHGLSEISEVKVIVKKLIIDHCQQVKTIISKDLPDVYSRLSYYIPWINTTILANGGLASCDYSLIAQPTLGEMK